MRAAIAFLMVGVLWDAGAAQAETIGSTVRHRVYVGGLELADVETRASVSAGRFEATATAKSIGFLGRVFPFETAAEASGSIADGNAVPKLYKSRSIYRGETRDITVRRASNGAPEEVTVVPPTDPEERDPVPAALQAEAVDALSAIVSLALGWKDGQECTGTVRLFNGRTRTDVTFTQSGQEVLAPTEYAIFTGEAMRCEVSWKVVAGGYKKKWTGFGRKFPPASLWLAQMDGVSHWVPVRLEADAIAAQVVAHLTSLAAHGLSERPRRLTP